MTTDLHANEEERSTEAGEQGFVQAGGAEQGRAIFERGTMQLHTAY
jgi:hypothetical protein